MKPVEVVIMPNKGFEERFTPSVVKFLQRQLAARFDEVLEAVAIIKKRDRWSIRIVWDDEAPEVHDKRASVIYWAVIDSPVRIRCMIGSFNTYKGVDEEVYVAEFTMPGLGKSRRKPGPKAHVHDPSSLLALIDTRAT
ncbi:MAG: hypothetical protein JRN21_09930 [Nitrososphaerota archaeon]|nr:hypothetical protein [Nitrososphaerota archaeon]